MNLIIPLLLFIKLNLTISTKEDTVKEIKQYSKEKKAKALACSYLLSTPIPTKKNSKRQIRELLKKNGIIERKAETKEKIYLFLTALCYKKIKDTTANDILVEISAKKTDALAKKELTELFNISPNLNYKKIQKTMDTVMDILEQIEEEEESKTAKNKDEDSDEIMMDEDEKKKKSKIFNIKDIINNIKEYLGDFEFEEKTLYSIIFSLLVIISVSVFICNKNKKNNNNIKEEKIKEKHVIKVKIKNEK